MKLMFKNGQPYSGTYIQNFFRINFDQTSEEIIKRVVVGSLVKTSIHNYFIATSLGEITLNNIKVFCISPQSPIGKLLLGKHKGDTISFQSLKATIQEIY